MIKKFVSKALLSLVMDKDARDRLEARKKSNPARKAPSPEPAPEPPRELPDPEPARPPGRTKTEDTHELILGALKAAEQELAEKREMTPQRQALIQQALNVQRSKEHVLNSLSRKQREKLYVVALKTLQSAPEPGIGKKALKRKKRGK
ncbi:MAG: hypothetical protein IH994_09780 [Proteobacteria bacterium]|nr:hypothetical protein [Pseudomonadota bacterium]